MPLLLAIEPDARHASWIAEQARGRLGAELVVTDSVDAALKKLAERVPDLVLTSLLLSPRDEARLQEQLRQLGTAGIHVQTLVIPVLCEPSAVPAKSGGVLSRLRKRRASASDRGEGCDPAVFGAQIAEYLRRTAGERAARPAAPRAPEPGPDPVPERVGESASVELRADEVEPFESPSTGPFDLPLHTEAAPADTRRVQEWEREDTRVEDALETPVAMEAAAEPPPVESSPVDDVFPVSDRAWKPRVPLVVQENEYDPGTLLDLLDQAAPWGDAGRPGWLIPAPARAGDERETVELLVALRREVELLRGAWPA